MVAVVLSIQSLNNIWMMSIRKCSIGVVRWCFFFKPRSVIFPGRRWLAFFFISIGESWVFPRRASKWKHAGVSRNTTSFELAWKNLADLHWKFYRRHQQQNFLWRKEILSASVCKKDCTMSAEKYMSRLHNDRCRLLYFLFNPWIIFGWCLLGNVRSASSGDASFLNQDRSSFLADID